MLMFIMLIVPWGENIFKTIGHVGGFLWVLWFPPPIKLTATI